MSDERSIQVEYVFLGKKDGVAVSEDGLTIRWTGGTFYRTLRGREPLPTSGKTSWRMSVQSRPCAWFGACTDELGDWDSLHSESNKACAWRPNNGGFQQYGKKPEGGRKSVQLRDGYNIVEMVYDPDTCNLTYRFEGKMVENLTLQFPRGKPIYPIIAAAPGRHVEVAQSLEAKAPGMGNQTTATPTQVATTPPVQTPAPTLAPTQAPAPAPTPAPMQVSPSPAVAPSPPAVPIEQLLKRITEIEKQMQEQKAAADKQTQQKDAAMAVLEKRVKGIEEELQAEKTARAEERAASEERQRVAMEIREHGESQACKKLVAELATMQEQLQKAKSALIKLQDLIASGLVPGVFVDETEKQVQTLEGEVARLTEELARQKKQDEVLTDSGAEALRQIKELKELLEKGGLQKPATRGLSSRAQAQNSNQDLVDIRFQSMPSWKDMPPENSLVACITDEVFHIRDFADTTKRFAEAFLAEAEMITEDRVKHGKVLEKFPKLTRETTKAVVVFTMELQMVDPRARDHDEFYRNLGIVIRVRDSAKMQKLHGYGHYLFRGLTALTPYEGILWRGIAGRKQVILAIDNYSQEHMDIFWSSFSSGTPSREVAAGFAQKDTEDTEDPSPDVFPGVRGLLFRIETTNCARDVRLISAVSGEDERTILPNTTFVLIKLAHVGSDGLLEIHMKEKPEQKFKY